MDNDSLFFRRVSEYDIQLIRSWRNSRHVRLNMINQDFISPEQQISWFRMSRNRGEDHFIYSHGVHDVGLVTIKNLDPPGVFEAGIFCGRTDYLGSYINIAAAMGLYDYGFQVLGNSKSRARVLRDNSSALRMNESLGYVRIDDSAEKIIELELTRSDYEVSKSRLIRFVPATFSFREGGHPNLPPGS